MKIKLNNLKPNPYRDLKKYPIKQERVEALKASIEQTGFWDNVLARPSGRQYELAYGHNRLIALQQLGIEEIDIPIKNISDADMVRIMATENREQYDENQAILIETVQTVRDFLNNELKQFNSLQDAKDSDLINSLSQDWTDRDFTKRKNEGVGQTTILKFLGKGWKQWKIQHALEVLNSEEINPEAVKKFETTGMGSAFTKAVKEINKESKKTLDFKEQEKLANKLNDRLDSGQIEGKSGGSNYYTTIKEIVKEEYLIDKYKPTPKPKNKSKEDIIKYESLVAELRNRADVLREDLRRLNLTEKELNLSDEIIGRKLLSMSLQSLSKQIQIITKSPNNEESEQTNNNLRCITERC